VALSTNGSGTADGSSIGHDTFVSGVSAVRGSEFNDIITGNGGNNTLEGQGGNDDLIGNGGNDTISGGDGNDTINGGGGADLVTGGTGADRFVFNAASDSTVASHDTISDFVHGSDVIDTSAIAGITAVQGLISGTTQVAANSVVWIQSGADTIVYANSTGTAEDQGSANMQIILANVTASALVGTDFLLHV